MAGVSVKFAAVDEISNRFDAMYNAGQKVSKQFDEMEDAVNSALETLGEMADQAASEVISVADATDYWTDALGGYNESAMLAAHSLRDLVDEGYMTEDVLTDMAAAVERASDEMEEYGESAEGAGDSSEEFGDRTVDAMETLSSALVSLGIARAVQEIGEAFMACSEAAAEFETNVAMVSTVADTTVLSADELAAQIRATSEATAQSVNILADSTYNAISAGVDTADAVSTVEDATRLAVAGFTDASSALSVLTTATNAYQLEASEMTNISDSLVMSQNLGVMTIDQLSSSMGKAISTASAYSVDLYNLESGYISLTKAGISVEESTTYISGMFNELGDSGSEVAKVIQEETGKSFGQLMSDGYTLADVLGIVYESVDQNSEALMNLWGSAEAGKAANAVINQGLDTFNANLDKLRNSSGTTAAAYQIMTNTSAYATQRLENSMDNLQIAIGDDLNPALSAMKNGLADIIDGATGFVEKYPAVSAGLTGAAVGIGTVTLAVTAYTAVTKIAAVASAALGTTMTAALGPLALVALAIGAVTTAAIYLCNSEDEAKKAQEALTASSQEQYDELEALKEQYAELEAAGEADTVAAYQLKNQIDELSVAFEENGQTIGDLIALNEQYAAVLDSMETANEEAFDSIKTSESDAKSLIAQLSAMTQNADLSGGQLEIMQGIVDRLNGSYEGLNLTLDDTNGKLNMSVEELWKAVTVASEQEQAEQNMEALMGYLEQYQEFQSVYQEAIKTQAAAKEEYERALNEDWGKEHPILAWTGWADGAEMNWSGTVKDAYNVLSQAETATQGAADNFDQLDENIRACYETMGYSTEEIDKMMGELALASASATDFEERLAEMTVAEEELISQQEAESEAISGVSDQLQSLCEAYDEAYLSALESVQGQYSLWDSIDEVVAMTSENITSALQSQIDYWNAYNSNLDMLTEKATSIEGLTEVLSAVADGSENSAAMLAGMASMNDEELAAMVEQYNNLQTSQGDTAASMADLATNFSTELDEMVTDMQDAVKQMNMEDEAASAASATMDSYISTIRAKTAEANSALSALSFANSGLNGYATGTLDAEPGLALVGEEGPELVNFKGGEVVYTTDETQNILASDSPGTDSGFYAAPESEGTGQAGSGDKTITLRIEGGGELKVGGDSGISKEDVLEILVSNIKGTLMGIIQQEIMEEGELSYEF